ncbi:MAG: hypothetical protein M1814_004371 [Vezdaea aestivalis]|nr:MAG: hypothetical protein M1814_004371 [Vezdaea aestivalis]
MTWSPSSILRNGLQYLQSMMTEYNSTFVQTCGPVSRRLLGVFVANQMLQWTVLFGVIPLGLVYWRRIKAKGDGSNSSILDPGLLKKYSTYKTIDVQSTGYTYSQIRIFYRPHPQAAQLPTEPAPLPLLVFLHGLGGSVAQFHPLLTTLVNNGPCLAIDLPGCGLSEFSTADWEAYRIEALASLVVEVIKSHLSKDQKIVLVGHSLGCSIATLIASETSTIKGNLADTVVALVAICPRGKALSANEMKLAQRLKWMPSFIFDLFRTWDRRGGITSASVNRFVGKDGDDQTKKMQLKFNESVKSKAWMRIAHGLIPRDASKGGLSGREIWAGLKAPTLLIAGEADQVTKASEIDIIVDYLGKSKVGIDTSVIASDASPAIEDLPPAVFEHLGPRSLTNSRHGSSATISSDSSISNLSTPVHANGTFPTPPTDDYLPSKVTKPRMLKTVTLPAPAGHALLYMPSSSKILGSIISTFLEDHVSRRLSLAWQLAYLSTEGKWDVKNVEKWKLVLPVSGVIAGVFRAMKTLREVDDRHRPDVFARDWGDTVKDVVDISHESPVYNPKGLESKGVRYHKFPTVSKIPPSDEEVAAFVTLIDRIRTERGCGPDGLDGAYDEKSPVIGVHCHYGYNRTGYFLVCYLVDRRGFSLQDAIDEFERQKPPGIRHPHFINALHVRYCIGLQRRPTLL